MAKRTATTSSRTSKKSRISQAKKPIASARKIRRTRKSLSTTTKRRSTRTITIKKKSGVLFSQRPRRRAQLSKLVKKIGRRSGMWLRKIHKRVLKAIVWWFQTFFVTTALSLFITALIVGSSYGVYTYVFKDLPSPASLSTHQPPLTTKILDRNGRVLFQIYEDEDRTLIPLSQVPPHLIQATIAIEDQNFFHHHGFSIRGIFRALKANSQGESIQGGSTITQQLVKNRLLSPERTLRRKLREVVLSLLVEGTYSKEDILEMYLNEVAYGGSAYGIEAAAQRYFGKSARDLSLAESSLLAGLPAAPSIYSPFGSNPQLARSRQAEVLRRMVEDGYITEAAAQDALSTQLSFKTNTIDIQAPHFVMYVKQLLAEQYGEEVVQQGGLEVRTTLDMDLQQASQAIVTNELQKIERLRISNGAALVTNPQTGEILSMVGSKNYFDFAHDGQVNVVLRNRQPGSSIKPLTYALAFERGRTPVSIEEDAPITYSIAGSKPYSPKNYDGKFHGRVTLRQALASSYNIPAVKLLASIGLDSFIAKAQAMGITTWNDRNRYGLSMTLGSAEVKMIDMAKLYGTFANYGYTTPTNPFLEIKTHDGHVLYRNTCALDNYGCARTKTLDSRIAYQITDILSDNNARSSAFGLQSLLTIPNQQVAVKTGTSNDLRDNWAIGYTTDRLVAVWVGNNNNQPMSYVASGITGATPVWNSIINLTLPKDHPHQFAQPEGLLKVAVCAKTGTLACAECGSVKEEYFVPGTEPRQHCSQAWFSSPPPLSSLPQLGSTQQKTPTRN